MKARSLLVAAAAAFALVAAPAVAFANTEPTACEAATAAVAKFDLQGKVAAANSAATRWDNRATEQQGIADAADRAAADAQALANRADAVNPATEASIKARDEYRAVAADKTAERDAARGEVTKALSERDSQRALAATGLQAQLSVLIGAKDKACATPAPTTPPAATPGPTTPPAATPPVVTPPLYDNCADAVAVAGTDIPRADPAYHESLDSDLDGIACEEGVDGDSPLPQDVNPPAADDDDDSGFPSTAPETGGA